MIDEKKMYPIEVWHLGVEQGESCYIPSNNFSFDIGRKSHRISFFWIDVVRDLCLDFQLEIAFGVFPGSHQIEVFKLDGVLTSSMGKESRFFILEPFPELDLSKENSKEEFQVNFLISLITFFKEFIFLVPDVENRIEDRILGLKKLIFSLDRELQKKNRKMYPVEIFWKIGESIHGDILINAGESIPDDSLDDNPRHSVLLQIILALESLRLPVPVTLTLGLASNSLWVEVFKIHGVVVSEEAGTLKLFVKMFSGASGIFDKASFDVIRENFLMGFKELLGEQIPVEKDLAESLRQKMNRRILKKEVMEFLFDNFS